MRQRTTQRNADRGAGERQRREAIGNAIKRLRGDRTQGQVGEALGLPQATVSRWERGEVELTYEQVRSIEIAMEVEPGTLARAAGYVDGASVDVDVDDFLHQMSGMTFAEVKAALDAAETLGLGVRLTNRWVPSFDTQTEGFSADRRELDWFLELAGDAPDYDYGE